MEEVALFRDRVWSGGGDTGRVHTGKWKSAETLQNCHDVWEVEKESNAWCSPSAYI